MQVTSDSLTCSPSSFSERSINIDVIKAKRNGYRRRNDCVPHQYSFIDEKQPARHNIAGHTYLGTIQTDTIHMERSRIDKEREKARKHI